MPCPPPVRRGRLLGEVLHSKRREWHGEETQDNPRRVKLLSPTVITKADEACRIFAIGPFRRLPARLPGPKLCLSPHPHRVRHEFRAPALATPARRPGGLPIASPARAPRSGAGPVKCIVGSASASCATTTDTPLNAVPAPRNCRTAYRSKRKGRVAACRGRTKPLP
jgi:hypothetical protein